jgi:hypothetical protein
MICNLCQDQTHTKCTGRPWCDCQHDDADSLPKDVPLAWGNTLRGPA